MNDNRFPGQYYHTIHKGYFFFQSSLMNLTNDIVQCERYLNALTWINHQPYLKNKLDLAWVTIISQEIQHEWHCFHKRFSFNHGTFLRKLSKQFKTSIKLLQIVEIQRILCTFTDGSPSTISSCTSCKIYSVGYFFTTSGAPLRTQNLQSHCNTIM